MRQVMLAIFSFLSVSILSGCTVVAPQYNHQIGGFPMYSSVKEVTKTSGPKVEKPVTVRS